MKITPLEVNVGTIVSGMTMRVTITGKRSFRFRLWAGSLVMKLGAKIIGVGHVTIS